MSYLKRTIIILLVIGFVLVALFTAGINLYSDWLWFSSLNFQQIFLTIFMTKIWVRLAIGALFTIFIYVNLRFTRKKVLHFLKSFSKPVIKVVDTEHQSENKNEWITKGKLNLLYLAVSIILGFLTSSISTGAWEIVQKYFHKTPFGSVDPIFSKDIGFYIFELPFLRLAYSLLTGVVVLTGIIVAIVYVLINLRSGEGTYRLDLAEKLHLSGLAVIFFAIKAFGYRLDMYNLLYSTRGVVFGASYTDVNVQLFALKVLMVVVGLLAIFTLINIFTKKMKLIYGGIALWILVSVILGGIYPGIVQKYQVEPNEIAMEKPYISHNIDHTLRAYDLDNIETRPFSASTELNQEDIILSDDIINNIRLWDWRPLQKTYAQIQEIRPYYDISHVDVDRYNIDGIYRQVMLGAREMNQGGLPARAQTWINQVLKYTHGLGAVMSPVNVVTPEGMPELFIKNIPPISDINIQVDQPRIYYGEMTNSYVIANSVSGERDYSEQINHYDGQGGIPINSFWRKLVFAMKYSDLKIILSNDIQPESRIMFDRNIMARVNKIAPFFKYDRDPYLVISEGKMYWIVDGYTTSDMYPYSEPIRGWGNYVRNSVKVVIDAYQGTVDFYIADDSDPIAKTYGKIFPDLLKPLAEMPEDLQSHIRYPADLFTLQSEVFMTYHMKDPVTFFNKEDKWNIPREKYAGETIPVQPYYLITRLPGEENLEFILFQPFTPATKNNLVAWMVAKSDGESYGKKIIYTFPKDRNIYGPMMIEARIDQDSEISSQLTLWDQKGSSVIRGNLLTIPIKNSILYVEPIFLQSQDTQLPELKRVIVGFDDEIVMEPTLQAALAKIFGNKPPEATQPTGEETGPIEEGQLIELPSELKPYFQELSDDYFAAIQALEDGDFATFGEKMDQFTSKMEHLLDVSNQEDPAGVTENTAETTEDLDQ